MQFSRKIQDRKILPKNIRTARRKRSLTKYKITNARTKTQNRLIITCNALKTSHKISKPAKKAMTGFLIKSFIFSCFVLTVKNLKQIPLFLKGSIASAGPKMKG